MANNSAPHQFSDAVPKPDEGLPALFWDDMPEDKDNPDLAAINSIIEETSPNERVLGFKDQGNRALQTGLQHRKKYYLRQAIEQYTEGINVEGCDDTALKSIVYSNRAHVNLLLGNYRNALMDAKDAIRYDGSNVKAFYRAAKASAGISLWDECRQFCTSGLELDPNNEGILKILNGSVAEEEKRRKAAAAEAARQFELRKPAAEIAQVLESRGWKIGRPQFGIDSRKPRVENDEVRWPVLFFYPEGGMQSDAIEDFGEHDTFAAHLDIMFGENAPPLQWDIEENKYTRKSIEVYYLSNSARPIARNELIEALFGGWPSVVDEGPERYGSQGATWVRVNEKHSLGEVISREDHVIPGVPVFFILAKTTPFRESFLAGDIPLL
jgi:tetratricopeptide (TPR) repeat protein